MKYLYNHDYHKYFGAKKQYDAAKKKVPRIMEKLVQGRTLTVNENRYLANLSSSINGLRNRKLKRTNFDGILENIQSLENVSGVSFHQRRGRGWKLFFTVSDLILRSSEYRAATRLPTISFCMTSEGYLYNQAHILADTTQGSYTNILIGENVAWSKGHPHLVGPSEACWGNEKQRMIALRESGQLDVFVSMLLRFLEEVNTQDTMRRHFWSFLVGDPTYNYMRIQGKTWSLGYTGASAEIHHYREIRWSPSHGRWGYVNPKLTDFVDESGQTRFYLSLFEYIMVPINSLMNHNYEQRSNDSDEYTWCSSLDSPPPEITETILLDEEVYNRRGLRDYLPDYNPRELFLLFPEMWGLERLKE